MEQEFTQGSDFFASRMTRSTCSLMLISSVLPTGRSRFRTCQELRQAEEHAGQQKAPESRQTRPDDPAGGTPVSTQREAQSAGWDTLVIPQSCAGKLQADVKVLRDFEAYRAASVFLPKGLLAPWAAGLRKNPDRENTGCRGRSQFRRTVHLRL